MDTVSRRIKRFLFGHGFGFLRLGRMNGSTSFFLRGGGTPRGMIGDGLAPFDLFAGPFDKSAFEKKIESRGRGWRLTVGIGL